MAEKKVLVANDEFHVLQALSVRLRSAGYQVLTARDGQEALETARRQHPDLVITDYAVPRLSGLELCQKLKHDPRTADIPAIVLTATGYDVDVRDPNQSGVHRLLPKPFNRQSLLASVSEVLDGTRADA